MFVVQIRTEEQKNGLGEVKERERKTESEEEEKEVAKETQAKQTKQPSKRT